MSKHRIRIPAFLATLVLLAGCGGGEENYISGSCQNATLSNGGQICIDATPDSTSLVRQSCRIAKGRWVDGESCPTANAVAGCRVKNGSTIWSYPSDKVSTVADIRDDCNGLVIEVPPGS